MKLRIHCMDSSVLHIYQETMFHFTYTVCHFPSARCRYKPSRLCSRQPAAWTIGVKKQTILVRQNNDRVLYFYEEVLVLVRAYSLSPTCAVITFRRVWSQVNFPHAEFSMHSQLNGIPVENRIPAHWNVIRCSMTRTQPALSPSSIFSPPFSQCAFTLARTKRRTFQECCYFIVLI